MKQFSLIPPLLKMIIKNKNNFLFFIKECHLLSDKLESMEILSPEGFKPEGAAQGFIIEFIYCIIE